MDYSLYLTVEHVERDQFKKLKGLATRNRVFGANSTEIYHIGIIDYLQDWSCNKRMEACAKSIKENSKLISAVKPGAYQARFANFLKNEVFVETFDPEDEDKSVSALSKEIESAHGNSLKTITEGKSSIS